MANPQVEDGYTPIANEIVDALMRVNLSGAEIQVIWAIFRKTYGFQKKTDWIALSQFAKMTGMDRRAVHRTLKKLSSKQMTVIQTDDRGRIRYGFNKNYEQWRVSSKQTTSPKVSSKQTIEVSSKQSPTKESITKERKNIVRVPYQEIVDLYHEILPELPRVVKISETRKKHLKARWLESEKTQSLEWWRDYFEIIKERPFLMGENDRNWQADFDFLITESKFLAILGGKYKWLKA